MSAIVLSYFPDKPTIASLLMAAALVMSSTPTRVDAQNAPTETAAYEEVHQRVLENRNSFFVYQDQDSGFNHGFPSGFFASSEGNLRTIHVDTGCVDDPSSTNGCSTNPNAIDRAHQTVMKISFYPQTPGNYAGVNIEEPENWGVLRTGAGYDLRGSISTILDVRSPDHGRVQFGVGGCNTPYTTIPSTWTTLSIRLDELSCTPDLSDVHILFAIATNDLNSPHGGTFLVDNVRFDPVPTSHQSALSFPLGNQTFGVLPRQNVPVPSDQVLRNLTTTYESALAEEVLLARGTAQDLADARLVADTNDYVLHHDNHGDPLPVAQDGSIGLHNGYESGDASLFNNQQPPKLGKAGDIRLAGFTATTLCAPSDFCLVLDGATGGNNAFAILGFADAFVQFRDARYLEDAVTIADWVTAKLADRSSTGYGGYFVGYPDLGVPPPKPLQKGKSVENNADLFAAFTALANVESQLGNAAATAKWTTAADMAGDFVMLMYDPVEGRFNAGTVPVGTPSGSGICADGPQKGIDVINTCDFLDSDTFTTLAMAGSPRYERRIDWRLAMQHVLSTFAQTVTADGRTFHGFDIVEKPLSGANGIAWEFTGQVIEALRYVDKLYSDTRFESAADDYVAQLAEAQSSAPFRDSYGLVASTMEGGDTLPPSQQCLNTPFQCIAERVGLAATAWAIAAAERLNPFWPFPVAEVAPASASFAAQKVKTASPRRTVTLTNTGSAGLTLIAIRVAGPLGVDSLETTCSTSRPLPVSGSCTVGLTFTPTAVGAAAGTLSFTDNALGSPQIVVLKGTGTAPVASISRTALTFSSQNVGTQSSPQPVTLKNVGTAALSISKIVTTANFRETNNCGALVAVGTYCTIEVTFLPTLTGALTGGLTIVDDSGGVPGSKQKVSLSGTGLAPIGAMLGTPSAGVVFEAKQQFNAG